MLVAAVGLFFTLAIIRLIIAAISWRGRRSGLIALAVGVGLWAAGSTVLNAAVPASATEFPAPGEWLFLASYVAIAAYLIFDVGNRSGRAATAWLDATIVVGGAGAALASACCSPRS